jgi:hypothetical protein
LIRNLLSMQKVRELNERGGVGVGFPGTLSLKFAGRSPAFVNKFFISYACARENFRKIAVNALLVKGAPVDNRKSVFGQIPRWFGQIAHLVGRIPRVVHHLSTSRTQTRDVRLTWYLSEWSSHD